MTVSERTLSDFLQHSGRVLPDLDIGEVLLRRRDGEDLVLMTRGQSEALGTVLRVFVAAVNGDEAGAEAVLPWLAFLSPSDRQECLQELGRVAAAAVASGRLSHLRDTLYEWEATGLAAWDEQRNRERAGYAEDDSIPLERPSS